MSWDLTGNAGTNPTTNFLGTTDNQPLVIKTNGAESMRITANGTVGIGTNSPANTRLEIVGTTPSSSTQYDSIIAFAGTDTDGELGSLYHRNNGATSYLGIESFNVGNTAKTPLVLQEYGGSVGIGTNAPIGRLHIVGTTLSTDTTYDPIIVFAGTDGAIGSLYHRSNGTTSTVGIGSNNVGNTAHTPLVLQEYGGNVGIGTNQPDAKLTVAGLIHSTTGGIKFPDGSTQTTATLRGPQGPQGPQGTPGPAVHTSAVCGSLGCLQACSNRVIAQQPGDCAITSDTGSCNAPAGDWCCVCAP